jgi:hypothetical protein
MWETGINKQAMAEHLAQRIVTCEQVMTGFTRDMSIEQAIAVKGECMSMARVFRLMPQLRVEINKQRKGCQA